MEPPAPEFTPATPRTLVLDSIRHVSHVKRVASSDMKFATMHTQRAPSPRHPLQNHVKRGGRVISSAAASSEDPNLLDNLNVAALLRQMLAGEQRPGAATSGGVNQGATSFHGQQAPPLNQSPHRTAQHVHHLIHTLCCRSQPELSHPCSTTHTNTNTNTPNPHQHTWTHKSRMEQGGSVLPPCCATCSHKHKHKHKLT